MKKIKRWLKDYFNPEEFNDLAVGDIANALNDASVRSVWLSSILEEMRQINISVDKRLLSGADLDITDLCARRKAYQDILEAVLSARRTVVQGTRPNPLVKATVNLDHVTA